MVSRVGAGQAPDSAAGLDDPELAVELHRRASHWFAGRGEAVEAVRHAVRAHDWDLVGELMVGGAAHRRRRCSSGGSRLPPPRWTWPAIVQKLPYADVARC